MKNKEAVKIGVIGGFIASMCCLGPVILVMLGLTGVSFALSIGKYTWFFLSLGILFAITALLLYFKKNNCCNIKGLKENWLKILIVFLLLTGVLIITKFWIATYLAKIVYRWKL